MQDSQLKLAAALISLVALLGLLIAMGKVVWHTYGMIRGVKPSADTWANLIPFIAFALPNTLDKSGQEHRFKLIYWLSFTILMLAANLGFDFLAKE